MKDPSIYQFLYLHNGIITLLMIGPAAFLSALFGPGSYSMPIHLDNVICSGSETRLSNCSHSGIGVENCAHAEDVSVDCLGRSPGMR